MKTKIFGTLLLLGIGSTVFAGFELSSNGKPVVCYGEDSQSWLLSADRSTITYTVEGESTGAQRIIQHKSDGVSFATYSIPQGKLMIGKFEGTFSFSCSSSIFGVNCKVKSAMH